MPRRKKRLIDVTEAESGLEGLSRDELILRIKELRRDLAKAEISSDISIHEVLTDRVLHESRVAIVQRLCKYFDTQSSEALGLLTSLVAALSKYEMLELGNDGNYHKIKISFVMVDEREKKDTEESVLKHRPLTDEQRQLVADFVNGLRSRRIT